MSVHKEITQHVKRQNKIITDFTTLDQERESFIEEAVSLCQQGLPFSTGKINGVTSKINELSKKGIVPSRKFVTKEMVQDYVERLTQN